MKFELAFKRNSWAKKKWSKALPVQYIALLQAN